MEKITPLPWRKEGKHCAVVVDGNDKFLIADCGDASKPGGIDVARANAAYIVKAANLYPELVESLTTLAETASNMLEAFQKVRPGSGYAVQQDINRAVKVLAKTKE